MPAFSYTEWEDFEYDLDLTAALDDEVAGTIDTDSFLITRRVQLTALSVIPEAADALLVADHAIMEFDEDTGIASDDDYGPTRDVMPWPDYTVDPVQLYAWRHAMDGDGGASFAGWYTIDHHWADMPEWDIPEGQHAATYAGESFPGDNPGVDLYDPYITPIDADSQTVTVSWQLYGDAVDDSYTIKIYAGVEADGDRAGGFTGVIIDVPINDLTVDIEFIKGHRHYVMVQWNGTLNMIGLWEPRGHRVLDPTTLAPTETAPGGEGFTVPSAWEWPPTGSGTSFWDEDTCVLVGSSWETTSQREDRYGAGSNVTALDAAFIRSYQGYWTVKGASTWADNIPPSAAPPESSFEIHTDYGSSATYEYDWTALGTITAYVDGPVRGVPDSPVQPLAAIELRPSDYADPSDLHVWKTILDLFATSPVADVEFDASDGGTLHVATNMTNDDPDVLTPAPMDYAGWNEWGTIRPARLAGTVRLIGQRRVKFNSPVIPPLRQRQRVSMNAVHATQAAAPDPLRFRAKGDL